MGTTAERSSIPVPATAGGWVELGRVTGNGSSISVSSLADKRYLMVLCNFQNGANYYVNFNGDTGSNYANRRSANGGGDTQQTSTTGISNGISGSYPTQPYFAIGYVANKSDKEKLSIWNWATAYASGAGNAPYRSEVVGKWANTSNTINEVFISNGQTTTPTEMVILGYDPADSHTNNFWEELYSGNASAASSITSSNFTTKKYLWIQCVSTVTTASTGHVLQVGNTTIDTGSNYAERLSNNGGSDATATSQSDLNCASNNANGVGGQHFNNIFIVNNASAEKLIMNHTITTQLTGASDAPKRQEMVGKWTNTSNQIDIVKLFTNTGAADYELRVWGAD